MLQGITAWHHPKSRWSQTVAFYSSESMGQGGSPNVCLPHSKSSIKTPQLRLEEWDRENEAKANLLNRLSLVVQVHLKRFLLSFLSWR